MTSLPNIQQLIDQNRLEEAVAEVTKLIDAAESDSSQPASAMPIDELYTLRGRLLWRLQRHADAVNDYERAVAVNPRSEAATALEWARDVFDFFNPDLLNP